MNNIGGIILAAGRGKRMNSTTVNKVALPIAEKPMIKYAVELLKRLSIDPIILVVGFAKASVKEVLAGEEVIFVEQKEQLGTADAVRVALDGFQAEPNHVIVIQGDDAVFYKPEMIKHLIAQHIDQGNDITFLTIELQNPKGLGRVVRDANGALLKVVEEKDATQMQRDIKEVNPACYVFNTQFLKENITKIEKSKVTQELYLTRIIDVAIEGNYKIQAVAGGSVPWRGVNTVKELQEAESLFRTS